MNERQNKRREVRCRDLPGDEDRGNIRGISAGFPRGWKDVSRDFRGNVVVVDFIVLLYGASASTKCIHCPLLSYAKRRVLNYNDNAN